MRSFLPFSNKLLIFQSDFEDTRPKLSAHKYFLRCWVVGDSIQDIFFAGSKFRDQYSRQIQKRGHLTGRRIDSDNLVGMPDIRPYLTVDVFKFVEFPDWLSVHRHVQFANGLKIVGIQKSQCVTTVAQYQILAVVGQSPAFGRIGEIPNHFE